MSSTSSSSLRTILAVVVLIAAGIAAYFVFKPPSESASSATEKDYLSAVAPVVSQAETLAARLGNEPPGPELFDAGTSLETEWGKVRTGPGYNRAKHDDFIIVFGSFVTRLKSAGLIWKALNEGGSGTPPDAQSKKLELLFTVQSLYGAETADQLAKRRGMAIDALLSTTNLAFEVTNSLARAPETLTNAVQLFRKLESEATSP